jgi:serine/threonine protein kinase
MSDLRSELSLHRSNVLHPLASYKTVVLFPGDHRETFEVLSRYEIRSSISRGTYGYVAQALDKDFRMPTPPLAEGPNAPPGTVAIKKVRGLFDHPRLWLSAVRELTMLRFFDHPHVIRAKDIMIPLGDHNNLSASAIEMRRRLFDEVYIVMDYMDNTLRGLMNEFSTPYPGKSPLLNRPNDLSLRYSSNPTWVDLRPLPIGVRGYLLFQMLHGLKYLHDCGVMHRDLKPENILVSWDWQAKICDFGQGRGGLVGDVNVDQSEIGQVTQWYCSPEHLRFNYGADAAATSIAALDEETFHAVDVWSIGCIVAEMIIGKPLFDCRSSGGLFQLEAIMNVLGKPNEVETEALCQRNPFGMAEVLTKTKAECGSRLDEVLRAGIIHRPAPEIVEGEDPTDPEAPDEDEIQIVQAMLQYDPAKRITIAEALKSPFFANFAEYAPNVEAKPLPQINKVELADALAARNVIWNLFAECHPVVNELVDALKAGEATGSSRNSKTGSPQPPPE